VRRLHRSVSLIPDAETYYKLGRGYSEHADSNNREHWLKQATYAHHCAIALDFRGEFTKEIDNILNHPIKSGPKPELTLLLKQESV
jgi:hypothetical protein